MLEAERLALEPLASKGQVVWAWQAALCVRLEQQGCLPKGEACLPKLLETCATARGHIGAIGAYLNWQLPLGYVQLIALFIKISMGAAAVAPPLAQPCGHWVDTYQYWPTVLA